ncbi:MAG: DUF1345 domain-containing protein [Isosphaeraceae bacterium]|nr:DUF1345 domain-containing protein [Isosphaeraceae bacterium]
MTSPPRKLRSRFVDPKGRLAIASLIAVVVYLVTFALETGLRVALAYDVAMASFLALHAYWINRLTPQDVQEYYQDREPSHRYVVVTAVVFSSLSMVGVGLMADLSKNWGPLHKNIHTACSLLAIVLSWVLLHGSYALYYAHRYYDVDEGDPQRAVRKGLSFPNDEAPDYWDFLYYSFTIAMCYQTSDVTVCSRSMRRVTLIHAVVSFLYVTAILGLVINILSDEI